MRPLSICFALLCIFLPFTLSSSENSKHTVKTTSGTLIGFSPSRHVTAFFGVPYAAPPVNDLRWMPPQPVKESGVPVNATKFGPVCMQYRWATALSPLVPNVTESEDCLTLNIWAPRKGKVDKGLPSMVWIHGGGFSEGSGSNSLYTGQTLAEKHDVIIVTLNYRLNIFGFPSNPAIPYHNLGFFDQRAAVEWLHKNIHAFGGDPEKMTLAGESAGAASINSYAYTYLERPLVRAFIMQSGFIEMIGDQGPGAFFRVAAAVGCNGTNEELVACMRKTDATAIQKAISNATFNAYATDSGGSPGIDNVTVWPMPELIERGLAGRFAKLPTLLGTNEYEGDFLVPFSPEKGINTTLADIVTKALFDCPSSFQALYRAKNSVPVYRYRYQGNLPSLSPFSWIRGAYHSAELPLLFGNLNLGIAEPQPWEVTAAKYFQDTWMAFVKDPAQGLADRGWPLYDPTGPTLVELLPDKAPGYRLAYAGKYDSGCENPPRVPWETFGSY